MADRKPQQGGPARPGGGAQPGRPQAARGGETRRERSREDLPPPPTGPRPTPRLRSRYDDEIRPALMQEFGYANVMQAPKVDKVVINIGMGKQREAMDNAVSDLEAITGQKPVVTRAKKSVANFKVRAGEAVGCMVTLRGARMYDFLDKLVSAALPRTRDFSGISRDAFDGRGNYSLGLREQLIFPEIEYDRVDRVRGMEVSIITTARTDDEGRRLLQLMGMPFRSENAPQRPELDAAPRRNRR
jgi:large subunit ribosomal protein L5